MKIGLLFLILLGCISSCIKKVDYKKELYNAQVLMEHNPDSSFSILKNMKLPRNISHRDNAMYCLLLTTAMDKTYRVLDSDSIINIALNYFKQTNDSSLLAQSYFYKGRVAEEMLKEELAIECFLKGINYCHIPTDTRLLFLLYYYLGNLYSGQELFEEELEAQKKAHYHSLLLNDSSFMSYSLSAIGHAWEHLDMNDQALLTFKKALSFIALTDSSMRAYIYNSIASTYNRIGDYRQAIVYTEFSRSMQRDTLEFPYIYTLKGHIYLNMHEYDSASYYYIKGLESMDIYTIAACYRGLYNIEREQANYEKSIFYNESYLLYRDSVEEKLRTSSIIKMRNIYQNDKLRDENHRLQLEKTRSENQLYKLCIIFTFSFLIVLILYFSFKIRKGHKIRQQEIMIAENQKELHAYEVEQMKKEGEMMKYRQKELSLRGDFYKKMIAISVPNLSTHSTDKRIKLSDSDWKNIIENVDVAFDGFSKRLYAVYPKLTSDDIRFCALLKMNLSVSELALIYCVEKISIYKEKERIKKTKMNIQDSTFNLDDIIHAF